MFFWCEKGTSYGNQSYFFGPLDDVVVFSFAMMLLSSAIYEVLRRIPFVRWCVLGEKKNR